MKNTAKIKENHYLIEPMRYLSALRKNWWVVLLVGIVFTFGGIGISKAKESKSWSGIAKVIRYDKKISMPTDIPYQFQNFNYETALETIRTRANLLELIKRLELRTTPESLYSKFEIKRGRNSDIIEVIYTTDTKELAPKGANTLSEIFIKNFYTIQNAAIEKIYAYYENSKQNKVTELEYAKKEIAKFLNKNDLISLKNELEMLYSQLNIIQLERLQNQTKTKAFKTAIREIRSSLKSLPDEVKLRYAVRSANKKALELKIKELQRLKKVYTSVHPKIKMIQSEIQQIKNTIKQEKSAAPDEVTYGSNPLKDEMKIELSKTKIAYATAINSEVALQVQIKELKKNITNLSSLKKQFDKLNTNKEEAQSQLKLVSDRLYDLKITIGSSKEDFKFFERAKEPKFPKPSYKKVIVTVLGVFGIILAIALIIVREFLNNSVKTKFDLSERFGIKEVVQLPIGKELTNDIKHSFSYLANSLISSSSDNTKLIAVGSDIPKGMSTNVISMLLEQLNQQNKNTLYVEIVTNADEEIAHKAFSLKNRPSKETLSVNHISENIDKAYWTIEQNYSIFIPEAESITLVVEQLRGLGYDYVIVQLPPYSEAEHFVPTLVDLSDAFLLIAEFGISSRKVIHQLVRRIEESSIDKIKGVINETHKYFIS
jgi:polysaccharide biosynthesis transport protein